MFIYCEIPNHTIDFITQKSFSARETKALLTKRNGKYDSKSSSICWTNPDVFALWFVPRPIWEFNMRALWKWQRHTKEYMLENRTFRAIGGEQTMHRHTMFAVDEVLGIGRRWKALHTSVCTADSFEWKIKEKASRQNTELCMSVM